jgi:predicted ArsR family transcriptional regulator
MDEQLDRLAALADPVRRAAYRCVADRSGGADRNEIATALGITRSLAAYHLDRLVDDGLLATRFEHRGTKPGPGSGRPSKVYERAPVTVAVTLPPRDYALAATIMADTFDDLGASSRRALTRKAGEHGRRLRAGAGAGDAGIGEVLRRCGYEPYERDGSIRLRNCPFDAIAQDHRALVCGMNLALLSGLLEPEQRAGGAVELDPAPGECCVSISGARLDAERN